MSRPRVAHVTTIDVTLHKLVMAQLVALKEQGFEVSTISAPGPWVDSIERNGIRHVAWHSATRSWSLRSDARALYELGRIFRRERFDVVHTHNPKPGIIGRIAARAAGVPVVINTCHGFYATREDSWRKRTVVLTAEWLAARCSDLELFQSAEDLRWGLDRRIVSSQQAVLLGNGTNLKVFDPDRIGPDKAAQLRSRLGIADGDVVVGTVGRLVAEKGMRELFAAARLVRGRHKDVTFVVVGEPDPDKSDAITEAELGRASGDVLFTGWRDDVEDLLAMFDVFVLPSWREGVPRSAIEAAAMGKPLVVTDIRGCREVVRHGREGFLVPVRDPERLADAISTLVNDEEMRVRFGRAARVRAVDGFDEAKVADLVVHLTTQLLERKGRAMLAADAVASWPKSG